MALASGTILNNRYRIEQLLGQGGFGAVYQAWDATFEQFCAIKENNQTSPEGERQFLREARLLHKLRHPNLPLVTDFFVLSGPQGSPSVAYLVMDYIEGEDLAEKIRWSGKPLNARQAVAWIGQVCDALSYLHGQNPSVIHRDIKPSNIRITPDDRAILVDFGIAKLYDPLLETTRGAQGVSPGFSPLEQYGSAPTDPRSDVYALGATLYCLLSGQAPPAAPDRFNGEALTSLDQLNPGIPRQVNRSVMKALELYSRDRWASVADFHQALLPAKQARVPETAPLASGGTLIVPPPPTATAVPSGPKQSAGQPEHRQIYWIAGVIVGAVLLLLLIPRLIDNVGPRPSPQPEKTLPAGGAATEDVGLEQTRAAETSQALAVLEAAPRTQAAATEAALPAMRTMETEFALEGTSAAAATEIARLPRDMVLIPAGEFTMGNDDGEKYGEKDEDPEHTVYLDAFYIDVYEVTNAQFSEFLNVMGNGKEGGVEWFDEFDQDDTDGIPDVRIRRNEKKWIPYPGYEDHPAVEMTWYGARAYCEWRGARLPTEAEWEKAARGGLEGALYPWGNEAPICREGATNGAQFGACAGDTIPIGSFAPNGFGLFDMAGNVWEFVQDWHRDEFYAESPLNNPLNEIPGATPVRAARGGSWEEHNDESYLRVARRDSAYPYSSFGHFGFRCALTP